VAKPVPVVSKQSAPPRRDPPRRHVDGTAPWAALKEKSTGQKLRAGRDRDGNHYVLVYENDPDAKAHYDFAGYVPCFWGQSDVVPLGGRTGKDGEPIVVRGHLLVRCTAERFMEIVEYGADGSGGKARCDELHNKIFGQRRPADFAPMRRPNGDLLVDFRNASSSSFEDLADQETA
jgi:hypothetical protein